MALVLRGRVSPLLCFVVIALIAGIGQAKSASGQLSVPELEDALQSCGVVQDLNDYKRANAAEVSGYTAQIFEKIFPGTPFYGLPGPAVNALLATLYISGPPNFLLALCPPNIDPSSLSVMVAFAVGGLLGDTLFHLLPEIFLGEAEPTHARFVLVEPNKNLLLGVAIMVGFVTFVAMDKGLRIATGGDGGHDHSHGQKKEEKQKPIEDKPSSATASGAGPETPNGTLTTRNANHKPTIYDTIPPSLPSASARKFRSMKEPKRAHYWLEEVLEEDADSGVTQIALWKAYETALVGLQEPPLEAKDFIHSASKVFAGASAAVLEGSKPKFIIKGVKPRRPSATAPQKPPSTITTLPLPPPKPTPSTSVKLSAYLNLIADFTHNITDGLAMSSSFYASPTLGATTAVAVFFHEIPHEVGDFALLVQSGFSKRKAMGMQFVTALGALLGTCIGIVVQELGKAESGGRGNGSGGAGLAGTGLRLGDMLLPFTAGTFLYVGTVAVIPELLEMGPNKGQELRKTLTQFVAMAAGAGIMFAISWS